MKRAKRILAILTVLAMVVTSAPGVFFADAYAAGDNDKRVADNTTLDGWKEYFGDDDNNFNTQYSGHVWTDKSVTTSADAFGYAKELADNKNTITINENDQNNFLVSLSAMASSKSIIGQDNKPTDTMIVLDLSSSMYGSDKNPATVEAMVDSVNTTIKNLQALNVNNRVGVTIYYGGPDLNQAPATCYQLWLPLDRYKHSNHKYLTVSKSNNKLVSVGVNKNVKTEAGVSVSEVTRTVPGVSGTYVQQGILSALAEFMAADTTVPETAEVNAGEARTPVMVLMSDGKPTAATNNFSQLGKPAIMGSNREDIRSKNETDFLTQLTASYAKEMMDSHYEKEAPIFYTLSLGSGISYTVMDPSGTLEKKNTEYESNINTVIGYWDKLVKNGNVKLEYKVAKGQWEAATKTQECTVSKVTVEGVNFPSNNSQMYYVDRAFAADDASDLENAFNNIFTDITLQTHTYPTLVGGDENLDGYISFVDKIGKYMSVTEVKGILLDEHWYSGKELSKNFVAGGGALGTFDNPTVLGEELVWSIQQRLGLSGSETVRTLLTLAYQWGQLSYDGSTGEYSNYVGWYSDEFGNYLGFWQEGVTTAPENAEFKNKSYVYLGETDESHGVSESDMMYTTVRVRQNIATGEESVSFAVPAALIPTVEFDIEIDENDNLDSVTRGGADHPIRLVYEVALDDGINEFTLLDKVDADYIAANTNDDETVSFYTNQFDANKEVGYGKVNTYSYFRPSHQNENYYYQENEPVYYKDGDTYKIYNGEKPSSTGEFYREITVYSKDKGSISVDNIYRRLSEAALGTAVDKGNGTWYIAKGNVHVNLDGYTIEKEPNKTNTLPNANTPYVDANNHNVNEVDHRFVIGDTLGNNGKVTLKPTAGIKLSKTVEGGNSTDEFEFVIKGNDTSGEYNAIKVAKNGTESAVKVKFENGSATVTLKNGESIYIGGLRVGTYTIDETEHAGYILSKVTEDGKAESGNQASVDVTPDTLKTVEFTNVERGTGDLTIAKLVNHPLGVDYQIPEGMTFEIKVKLEGAAISSDAKFKVNHSGNNNLDEIQLNGTGECTFTLKHGDEVEILDIPEGTKATISEVLAAGSKFTATYKENGSTQAGDGILEIQKAPANDTVVVENTYEPAPAEVKIDLSGVKTLVDGNGATIDNWDDLEFDFVIQKYVYIEGTDGQEGSWQWVNTETIDTVTNDNKTIDFVKTGDEEYPRTLRFDKVGTYAYQVIEKNHGKTINGITYDSTMHTFNVIVTDTNMDGKLEARVETSHATGENNGFTLIDDVWTNNNINFTNVKTDGQTSELVMIKKNLNNTSGSEHVSLAGYTFDLYRSNNDSASITDSDTKIATSVETDAAGESYIQLQYKYSQLSDEEIEAIKKDGSLTYYYKLKERAAGTIGMSYDGKVYTFKVTIKPPKDEENGIDSGKIVSDLTPTGEGWSELASSADPAIKYDLASFTNKYDPTDATISLDVRKTLEGKTLEAGDFEFELAAVNGAPLPGNATGSVNVKNGALTEDGYAQVNFGNIVFDRVGTYSYKVKETSVDGNGVTVDSNVYDVVITVTDEKDEAGNYTGKLAADVNVLNVPGSVIAFKNSYKPAPVDVVITGEKNLTGLDLVNEQFGFVLAESDENGIPSESGKVLKARNDANGDFAFDKITYDKPGTYYYVVTEEGPAEDVPTYGITYSDAKYLVTVTVTDDKKGNLQAEQKVTALEKDSAGIENAVVFTNVYKAAPTTTVIPGYKALENKNLEAGMFEFGLYKSDASWSCGENALLTAGNAADGTFDFELADGYFEEAGEYYFVIKEVNAGQTVKGITYDGKAVGVIVTVTDNNRGQLETSVKFYDLTADESEAITATEAISARFDNIYEVTGEAVVKLEGKKYLEGRQLKDGEFTFLLKDADGEIIEDTVNDAEGNFGFEIAYTPEDIGNTYEYTVVEQAGDLKDIKYDGKEYKVSVTVKDNGDGTIAAEVDVRAGLFGNDEIVFENEVIPPTPKTGDNINMMLYALMALTALGAAGAAVGFRRRTN